MSQGVHTPLNTTLPTGQSQVEPKALKLLTQLKQTELLQVSQESWYVEQGWQLSFNIRYPVMQFVQADEVQLVHFDS